MTMTPFVMTIPSQLVNSALVSSCEVRVTASATAPAHTDRFFMAVPLGLLRSAAGLRWLREKGESARFGKRRDNRPLRGAIHVASWILIEPGLSRLKQS